MRAAIGLAVVGLWVSTLSPRMALATTPKVVVVAAQGKGAPNLKTQVTGFIEKSLKQSVTIVPFAAYSKAAKAAGIRAKSITGPEAAVPAGKGVGASHVLIVQSVQDKDPRDPRNRKLAFFAAITLVDAVTGETLLSKRYPLEGKRLDVTAASLIVGDVLPRVTQTKAAMPAPAADEPPPPSIVAPQAPPPPTGGAAPVIPPPALVEPPPPPPVGPGEPVLPVAAAQNPNQPAEPPPAVAVVGKRSERWRPGLRAALTYLFFFRNAHINAAAGDQPPCYCEPAGVAAPLFSRPMLQLEVYPMAFTGDGSWYEGFGVHGDGSLGLVHTGLAGATQASSLVGGASGGVQYRYVLWDSITATDLQLRLGAALFSFPLNGAQFPGIVYRSPYVGLYVDAPVTDAVGLFVGANYLFYVTTRGLQTLGAQTTPGSGLHAEGGVRLTLFDMLDLKAMVNLDKYGVPFAGATHIPDTNLQYQNVSVSDMLWGFALGVGFVL